MQMHEVGARLRTRPYSNPTSVATTGAGVGGKEEGRFCVHSACWVFVFVLCFRFANSLVCSTWFVPDEYWQSLEVAHKMVFGYGYVTWEWQEGIRGYTHPLLFAVLYKMLDLLRLDWPFILIVLPRVAQGVLAAVSDVYVWKLASRLYGSSSTAGLWALVCNVMSWFTFYCITRTLANSIEAALTPLILFHWLVATSQNTQADALWHTRAYLVLAALSVLVRPTGALLWAPMVCVHLARSDSIRNLWVLFSEVLKIGTLALCWSLAIDCYFYGKFAVVQWNFLLFNVLSGHSAFYGTHPWHWYFTQGLPVVAFTYLPLSVLGAWWSQASKRTFFWAAVWLVAAHSCLGHKEFRFVFAVVPVAAVYSGYCISIIFEHYKKALQSVVCVLLLLHVPMALYFSTVHQMGATAVMDFLRKDTDANSSVLFLMPCHSTPYYSHIHKDIPMHFLECPPPIDSHFVDVSEKFYAAPKTWLASCDFMPSHIVMFDSLVKDIDDFLVKESYKKVYSLFHTHFPESKRFGTHVIVFKK